MGNNQNIPFKSTWRERQKKSESNQEKKTDLDRH